MFAHILVPLDGSTLAESALAPAACLARILAARVTLLHIVERDAPPTIHGEPHLKGEGAAAAYLDDIAARSFPAGIRVARHVHTAAIRDVAAGIVEHQGELAPDVIVMCTHGHHGLRGAVLGSMAQKVVSSGSTPVLLVRPDPTGERPPFDCRLLLVPVDGDPVHEQGLGVAVDLAVAAGSEVRLLSVVPTPYTLSGRHAATERYMFGSSRAALEMAVDELRAYQQEQLGRIRERGIAVAGDVKMGDTGTVIARTADECDASLIVLGTHGKRGSEAFWKHSVGAEVQSKTARPILLVPVHRGASA